MFLFSMTCVENIIKVSTYDILLPHIIGDRGEQNTFRISYEGTKNYFLSPPFNACSKSALISAISSKPTEQRTISGFTPAASCSASLNC